MNKQIVKLGMLGLVAATAITSCSDEQQFVDFNQQAKKFEVQVLNDDLAKVRDYVPLYAVIAHRGSTYWTPEETEASWRWARDMGADYLESDLQATKDGVVLSLHDDNLKRTTNIQTVFSDQVPNILRPSIVRLLTKTVHHVTSQKKTSTHSTTKTSVTTTATIHATTIMQSF